MLVAYEEALAVMHLPLWSWLVEHEGDSGTAAIADKRNHPVGKLKTNRNYKRKFAFTWHFN